MGDEIYVYAITRHGTPPPRNGAARDIRTVDAGGLSAFVGDAAPETRELTREALRSHSDVVQELFENADATLPLRVGTVLPDEDTCAEFLLANAPELEMLLDELADRGELRLTAFYDEDAILRDIVESDSRIRELDRRTSGAGEAALAERLQLGELVMGALTARRERDAAHIVTTLAPFSDAYVEDEPRGEWGVAAASFLVERAQLPSFEAKLEELANECVPRVRLRCVGPIPPYSFTASLQPEPV